MVSKNFLNLELKAIKNDYNILGWQSSFENENSLKFIDFSFIIEINKF